MVSRLIAEARKRQFELATRVDLGPFKGSPELIGGADISFNLREEMVYAVIVVLNLKTGALVEKTSAVETVNFPYVPGYLSFREVPPLLTAWKKLKTKPGIVMLDGHGIIHPRRFGLACHFGLEAGVATLGCAKKPFVGSFIMPAEERGSFTEVSVGGELRGYALRSRDRVKPVFVSPGTGMSLEDSLRFAKLTMGKYRLLEPTRQAHTYSNEVRQAICNG